MRLIKLKKPTNTYSSNVYYIMGDWSTLDDINTLIDVGTDGFILKELDEIYSGVGKRKVDQVIITHDHFDHSAGIKFIVEKYHPQKIYAFSNRVPNSIKITDGMSVQIGNEEAQIYHTPGHSYDSISVFIPKVGALFSGDNLIAVNTTGGTYTKDYYNTILKYINLQPKIIYPGHGDPYSENVEQILKTTLKMIENSKIID
ncbi:MAG: MBL fold metallo-hydrolase [Candidatus Kapaibacteriota bacterium]